MTAVLERPREASRQPSRPSVLLALARFEGRRMASHRLIWLGALLSAALAVNELREEAPVLNRVSVTLAWTMLPLAMTVALVAGWAVLRAIGSSDADPPVIAPLTMGERVGGIVFGLAAPAGLALLAQAGVLVWVFLRDPVTSLVWTELVTGPVYVVFAGSLGAALTRWIPHSATPLFTVLILGALMVVLPYNQSNWGRAIDAEWLKPLVWPQNIIPYEITFRPSGLHLIYLVALVVIAGGIAIMGRAWFGRAALASGLAAALIIGPMQLGTVTDARRAEAISQLVGDSADLTCETHNKGVVYCAMPGYEGWIDDWAVVTKPVIDAAPERVVSGLEVRQYPVHNTYVLDGDQQTNIDWWWFGASYEDYAERQVVAVGSMLADWEGLSWVAGLAPRIVGCDPWVECRGEAQQVAVLWLVVQYPRVQSYTISDPAWGEEYASVADCMIRDLWAKPDARSIVLDNWDLLTFPETTYEEAGSALGVAVPGGYDSNGQLRNGCP